MHIRLYVAELTVLQSEGWFGLVRGHVGGFMSGTLGDAAAVAHIVCTGWAVNHVAWIQVSEGNSVCVWGGGGGGGNPVPGLCRVEGVVGAKRLNTKLPPNQIPLRTSYTEPRRA